MAYQPRGGLLDEYEKQAEAYGKKVILRLFMAFCLWMVILFICFEFIIPLPASIFIDPYAESCECAPPPQKGFIAP